MAEEKSTQQESTDENITELPAVAAKIYIPCKKCDANRYFTILAHKTERSAQIQCEVCKGKRSFTVRKKKATTRKTTRRKSTSHKGQYEALMESIGPDNTDSYTIRGEFKADTAIEHPKFGLGFVTESLPHKIVVMFPDEQRELVHNRD